MTGAAALLAVVTGAGAGAVPALAATGADTAGADSHREQRSDQQEGRLEEGHRGQQAGHLKKATAKTTKATPDASAKAATDAATAPAATGSAKADATDPAATAAGAPAAKAARLPPPPPRRPGTKP